MSNLRVREEHCICSESERVCTDSYWICHCTASLFTTRVLSVVGKEGQKKLHLLAYAEVVDFSGRVSVDKFLEVWHRLPTAFSKSVQTQIEKEGAANRSIPSTKRNFLQGLRREWREDQEENKRRAAEEERRRLEEEALLRADLERARLEEERERQRIEELRRQARAAMAAANEEVTEEHLRAMEDCLSGEGVTGLLVHLSTLQDVYRYQGFDPVHIRNVFLRWFVTLEDQQMVNITPTQTISIGGIANLKNCLTFLAFLYNYRGNNTKAILAGLEVDPASRLNDVFNKLHIKDHVVMKVGGKDVKSKDTLTLSRIASAFPLYAMRVAIHANYDRKVIDMSDLGILQDEAVYKALCHPLAGSMLTKTQKRNHFGVFTFIAALKFNTIIGKQGSKSDAGVVWTYHQAVLNSKAAKEEHKVAYWRDLSEPDMPDLDVMVAKMKELGTSQQVCDEVVNYK